MGDITQRKQTEDASNKQSELVQSILANMFDVIVVADARLAIVLFNSMAERIFGPESVELNFTLYQADQTTLVREFPIAHCLCGKSFDGWELFVRNAAVPTGRWTRRNGSEPSSSRSTSPTRVTTSRAS
ncbi:MAG: hypothetical protein EXR98_02085 [Gemmataceae bacterium]|nr:hypothetical protein [Gemmataceae bacterium]